jgi:hypothetical protein
MILPPFSTHHALFSEGAGVPQARRWSRKRLRTIGFGQAGDLPPAQSLSLHSARVQGSLGARSLHSARSCRDSATSQLPRFAVADDESAQGLCTPHTKRDRKQ